MLALIWSGTLCEKRFFTFFLHRKRKGPCNSRVQFQTKREKTTEQNETTNAHTLCTGCRACLIPASYWGSISSVQISGYPLPSRYEFIHTGIRIILAVNSAEVGEAQRALFQLPALLSARVRESRPAFCFCPKAALWCGCASCALSRGKADLRRTAETA